MLVYTIIFYVFIFILGAVLGSFIGAMTWRMKQGMDWVRGRSECEHCHHQLAPVDLIPIVSYVSLRGKCRYCRKPIGKVAIRLEFSTGLAFLLTALIYPSSLMGHWLNPASVLTSLNVMTSLALGLLLVIIVLMIALFVYDLRWRLLPDKLVFPLIIIALIHSAVVYLGINHVGVGEWLINLGLGILPITGVYSVLYLLSRGSWIGLGDIKLGIAIGFLVPWWGGVIVLFMANLLGSLVSLPRLISHKIKGSTEIAFGPFLIISTYVVILFGFILSKIIMLVL